MTDVKKLSEISTGGAYNPTTDSIVGVRNGTTDVLVNQLIVGPNSNVDTALVKFSGGNSNVVIGTGILIDTSNNATGFGTIASQDHIITSNTITALAVGPTGSTASVFLVDCTTPSQADGLSVRGNILGSGVTLTATSPGSNAPFTLSSKGASGVNIATGGTTRLAVGVANISYAMGTSSTASLYRFSYTGGNDTSLTAGAEAGNWYINLGQTRQHASNTAITLQRDYRITGSTHSFVSSGGVITDAAAFSVDGPCIGGINSTLTNSHAILVPSLALSHVTNGYAMTLSAPTGATNNYAAKLIGPVVNGGTTPGIAAGAGTGGTTPTIAGCNNGGVITVTTGASPTGSNAIIATVTYTSPFPTGSSVVLSPGNNATASLAVAAKVYAAGTTTTFVITSGATALTGVTTYVWNYTVIGY